MSQSVFVLLHMRYRPSVIFPVAFRELLFCFVSNEVELASLPSPMIVYWQIWLEFPLNCQGNVQGHQRRFPPKCIEKSFKAIQSAFRSLEMRSKQRYKICICSVIRGELEAFRNYKPGLQCYFPDNFRCNWTFYESENFSYSSLHHIFESENFRFSFSTKSSLT